MDSSAVTELLTTTNTTSDFNQCPNLRLIAKSVRKVADTVPGRNDRPIPADLFSENIVAKILRTATERLVDNVSRTSAISLMYRLYDFSADDIIRTHLSSTRT
jgi:hypothetical protein